MSAPFLLMLGAGPVMGSYDTARAPHVLRAVRNRVTRKCDVLDLVEDRPEPDEDVFLYRRDPKVPAALVHIHERGRGANSRFLRTFKYEYVGRLDPETYELVEISDAERAWWQTQYRDAIAAWASGEHYKAPVSAPPEVESISLDQGALFV